MIFRVLQSVIVAAAIFLAPVVTAGEPVDKAIQDKISAALEVANAGLKVRTVKTSEIPGLYEVHFTDGPMVYATKDGAYFIVGDLYAVAPEGYVNLAEQRRDVERAEKMAAVSLDDMIVFSPEGKPRAYISVFTDVTCFYCQKLHKEVPQLNKQGVEVRYLAYPRAGVSSEGFDKLASAWCADNPQEVLTKLKNKESVPGKTCAENPIAAQYKLGQELGVRGTPAIVTQDGRLIPGYQSADDLMVTLGLN
jgi:thiol:disulfide interchange protein DsbC